MIVDKQFVRESILNQNITRLFYFVLGLLPLSTGHILFFLLHLGESGVPEYNWRIGIIASHSLLLTITLAMGFVAWNFRRRKTPSQAVLDNLFLVFFLFIVSIAVAIAVFDQIVTSSITPYMIICTVIALAFLIEPKRSFVIFLLSYILFFFALPFTQSMPDVLLSNRVNGFTVAILGFVLSMMMWKNSMEHLRKQLIIEEQSRDLELRNRELLEQSDKLEVAVAARDKFFSIIGHDLKSPFNALLGFSEILLEDWYEMEDEEKIQIVKLMKETSETTYQLLLNLLDWSRLQKEKMQVRPQDIMVRELTENVLAQLNAQATLKDISTELLVDATLKARVDDRMMNAIVRNLVSNAIKFSPRHSGIRITARVDTGQLHFCVQDHGIGISAERVKQIMGTSKVVSTEGTSNEQGTGLGLQLCREFVRMHNGSLRVESEPGKGSLFCFTIPQNL